VLKGGVILKASRSSSERKRSVSYIDSTGWKKNKSEITIKDVSSTSINETPITSSFSRLNYSSEESSF